MKNENIEKIGINRYLFNNIQVLSLIINIIFLSNISFADGKLINLIYYFSEINIVILGKGDKRVLSDNFRFEPSEVIINGESNNCKKVCNFQEGKNNVTLFFNDSINNCENMFYNLKDINEIDFSKFDFSFVTTTKNMFRNCTLLEKIEFGNNINTSSLITMESMFNECHNLKSLDLSRFNTDKVENFNFLLNYCKNLVEIDLGNINTSSA